MKKILKLILIPLLFGLLCFTGIYYFENTAVQCTIGFAYVLFLVIYGMIKLSPQTSSKEPENNEGIYELETEEEFEINNTEENETK